MQLNSTRYHARRRKRNLQEEINPEKKIFEQNYFFNLLKKIKDENRIQNKNPPRFITEPGYLLKQKNENNESKISQTETNENFKISKGEEIKLDKFLINMYESEHEQAFKEIKNRFEAKSTMNLSEAEVIKENDNLMYPTSEKQEKAIDAGIPIFRKTQYRSRNCMNEYYSKYHQFKELTRKYTVKNLTPSLAFIQSVNEEKIIPNPLGILKRNGDKSSIEMNEHKVGDSYIKCLSNSLLYSNHLKSLELSGNRITNLGTSFLFDSINNNKELSYKLTTIDLSDNKIGGNDIKEMINFIQDSKCNIENLNLYGNLLGDDNIGQICDSLAIYIENKLVTLNIGNNNIKDKCIDSICNMLKRCKSLKIFCISHNWLSNSSGARIIKELFDQYELKELDLSWNSLGKEMTEIPTYERLVNLNLNHPEKLFDNFILDEALTATKISLRRNPLLPPIDNLTGGKGGSKSKEKSQPVEEKKIEIKKITEKPTSPSPFAVVLADYFCQVQLNLVHLDISHNQLNYYDCKLLSEKSTNNHTMLGIHVDGNAMEINALGFIVPSPELKKENNYCSCSQIHYELDTPFRNPNHRSNFRLRNSKIDIVRKLKNKNNCWICEGFREIEFVFVPEYPIMDPGKFLVKIHLSFEDYKPFDMIFKGNKYHIIRMCPPGEVRFFFTVNTQQAKSAHSKEEKNEFHIVHLKKDLITYTFDNEYMDELTNIKNRYAYKISSSKKVNLPNIRRSSKKLLSKKSIKGINKEKKDSFLSILDIDTKNKITIKVDMVDKITVPFNKNVINEEYRKTTQFTEPRPNKIIDRFVKPRTPWTFPVSIWYYYGYDYEGDSEEYIDDCFNFDFDRCQFFKDFKDPNDYGELKSMLRKRYRDILNCYKYYSSFSGYNVWQITQNNLTEFINKCKGMCDKTYDINNIYLTQKVVCSNQLDKEDRKKGNKNLSDNIVRHQFMNLLVKSSKDKYISILKQTNNNLEAAKIAFEKYFDEAIQGFEYSSWKKQRYYNEEVDNFLKAYLPLLDALYLSWAKQKGPRKKDVWMVFDEFNNLVQNFVDINEYPIRDNPLVFNQSICLQINEIYTDKHLNMLLPEFLEGLCRTVDRASPIPPGENVINWPLEKRQKQPLNKKLENILPNLIKLITHPDFKSLRDKFQMPVKDINTGLYIINYDNPFYQGYIIKTGTTDKKFKLRDGQGSSKSLPVSKISSSKQIIEDSSDEANDELEVVEEDENLENKNNHLNSDINDLIDH